MTDHPVTLAPPEGTASTPRVRVPRQPFRIIRDNLGAYLAINVLVYGLVGIGFAVALTHPELIAARAAALEVDGTADLVRFLLDNVWLFALTIFAVNVFTAAGAQIVLPSLVVPFAGIAVFAYRTVVIGMTLAPANQTAGIALIPHSLTVLIEFQAYVLLMLGAYLLGRAWLRPRLVGAPNHRQGYLHGLRQFGWLALPALALFVVGAVYEAFSLVYLVPVLVRDWPF